jgi:hypothetical protein
MNRRFLLPFVVMMSCAGKKPPPAEPTPPPPVVAPEPPPPPEPEEPPAPKAATPNADLNVAITHADGSVKQGHVVRIERGEDVYAENGWTDTASKLVISLVAGSTTVDKPWTDIAQIDIKYGTKADIDCLYDSEFTPWMYMCTLRSTSTAKTTDGKTWTVDTRHKWKFTFADGSSEEFYAEKLPVREQDSAEVTLDGGGENPALYSKLQAQVMTESGKAVTKIVVTH